MSDTETTETDLSEAILENEYPERCLACLNVEFTPIFDGSGNFAWECTDCNILTYPTDEELVKELLQNAE